MKVFFWVRSAGRTSPCFTVKHKPVDLCVTHDSTIGLRRKWQWQYRLWSSVSLCWFGIKLFFCLHFRPSTFSTAAAWGQRRGYTLEKLQPSTPQKSLPSLDWFCWDGDRPRHCQAESFDISPAPSFTFSKRPTLLVVDCLLHQPLAPFSRVECCPLVVLTNGPDESLRAWLSLSQ